MRLPLPIWYAKPLPVDHNKAVLAFKTVTDYESL
jgi:hypothetical protein